MKQTGAFLVLILLLAAGAAEAGEERNILYYGGKDRDNRKHRLDLYTPKSTKPAPVLMFIHGGGWQMGDRWQYALVGRRMAERGIACAVISYRLSPGVKHPEHIRDCARAFAWLYRNVGKYGGDPERMFVSGHSAGGHLTGMLLAEGWQKAHNVPANVIKGACAISGLHDLEPFLLTSQKTYLKLDRPAVLRNSPIRNLGPAGSTLLVAWGGRETAEFQRQSKAYAEACVEAGLNLETIFMAEQNHFSMTGELADPDSPLTSAILRLMRLT